LAIKYARQFSQRHSGFVAAWIRKFKARLAARARSAKDSEIINRRAEYLNGEAADILDYQVEP
jgi:hypothetical protein